MIVYMNLLLVQVLMLSMQVNTTQAIVSAESLAPTSVETPIDIYEEADIVDDDWEYGLASAYGGWSDSQIIDNQVTYTEEVITEYSYGVAIPTCWDRSLIGSNIQIKYGDIVVDATINDIGYLSGGARDLDLQPGIFQDFGFDTCEDWGVREVAYRFID